MIASDSHGFPPPNEQTTDSGAPGGVRRKQTCVFLFPLMLALAWRELRESGYWKTRLRRRPGELGRVREKQLSVGMLTIFRIILPWKMRFMESNGRWVYRDVNKTFERVQEKEFLNI